MKATLPTFLAAALLMPSASADLVVHFKLDEADGDYTSGGYLESVSGAGDIATEVVAGTDVTEGMPAIAPDGGSSAAFTIGGDPNTHIDVGSLEDADGAPGDYIEGAAGSPYSLGGNFTISAWFSPDSLNGEQILFSNRFSSTTGWMIGTRNGQMLMDFGNTRASFAPSTPLVAGQDYLFVVRQDPAGDTNLGWEAGSRSRLSLYDVTNDSWQHFDSTRQKPGLNLQEMSIGRFTNGNREWNGRIDDLRIYDHTLTDEELGSLLDSSTPSAMAITDFQLLPDNLISLTWTSKPGRSYTIFYSGTAEEFEADAGDDFEADGESTTVQFGNPEPTAEALFFKVSENE